MTPVQNLLLCLAASLLMGGCQDLAKKIDQARDAANLSKYPIAKRIPQAANDSAGSKRIQQGQQSFSSKNVAGTWNTATTVESKCQALFDWVSLLEREYPETYKQKTTGALSKWPVSQYANLFRDKYFIPVFGVPYPQMADPERSVLLDTMERHEKGQCYFEYKDKFRPYFNLFVPTFAPIQALTRESAQLSSQLNQINAEEDRITRGLAKVAQLPVTEGSLNQLLNELNLENGRSRGRGDAILQWKPQFVWPSEQAVFQETVRQKVNAIALHLLDQTVAEANELSPSLTSARVMAKDLIPKAARYGQALVNSHEAQSRQATLDKRADEMLKKLLDEELKRLASVPNTWAGLEQSQKWYSEFQQTFGEFEALPAMKNASGEFSEKRELIFQGAIKDFEMKVATFQPPTQANVDRAQDFLRTTFPLPGDRALQSYAEYHKVVLAYQASGLSPIVATYLKRLRSIPPKLSGTLDLIEWKHAFDKEFVEASNHPLVTDAENEWREKRQLALAAAKPEFERKIKGFPPDNRGLRQAAELLDKIFSLPDDQNLPMFDEYEQIVLGSRR